MKKPTEKQSKSNSRIFIPPSEANLPWQKSSLVIGLLILGGVFFSLWLVLSLRSGQSHGRNNGDGTEVNIEDFPITPSGGKERITFEDGGGGNKNSDKIKSQMAKYREMLDRASTREEVLQSVKGLIALKKKEAWEILKLKILNKNFQNKIYQLDFTGRLDAHNRPELVPSYRRLPRLILGLMEKTKTPSARDILLTVIDSKVFYQPENNYRYSLHLYTLLAISRMPSTKGSSSSRALKVFRRILYSPPVHKYARAEKQWALMALKNLKSKEAYGEIKKFVLHDEREWRDALLGVRPLIEKNTPEDISALGEIGRRSKITKIRIICYKALAGIPGPYDDFGIRLTANREEASLELIQKIYKFLKGRLREERSLKALSILRRAKKRVALILEQKLSKGD